jgi:hypothetical protein
VGEVHQLLLDYGKRAALDSEFDRTVVEAAAAYLANEDTEIGFIYSGWCQAALPHKRLPDDEVWQLKTDHLTLMVAPGHRPSDDGPPIAIGVPFGSRARLILIYLQSEALRTQSREIELGRSLNAWLKKMAIPIGGKTSRDVRDQADRISRCRMSFQITQGNRTGLINQSVLDQAMFVDDGSTEQPGLFIDTAKLSEGFYEQLKRHPVPVEDSAIRALANNSLALDIYCWLAYRLHALKEPKMVTWKALHAQFGRSVERIDHFRRHFRVNLQLALAVYPEAKLDEGPQGVVLKPSRPPVSAKVVALGGSKRR